MIFFNRTALAEEEYQGFQYGPPSNNSAIERERTGLGPARLVKVAFILTMVGGGEGGRRRGLRILKLDA